MKENDIIYNKENHEVYQIVTDELHEVKKRDSKGVLSDFKEEDFEKYDMTAPLMARLNYVEGYINSLNKVIEQHEKVIGMIMGSRRI